jgi:replicative DNA helicase
MDNSNLDGLTEAERLVLQTPEQFNMEVWTANARDTLNLARSAYLVTDEADTLALMKYGAPAIAIQLDYIPVLLDVIRSGVIADRLFIPKGAKDRKPEAIRERLAASIAADNIPIRVYTCALPDGVETVTDYEHKQPGAFPAWIKKNDAVIDQERIQYEKDVTGAGRLDALTEYIKESASRPVISTGFHTLDMALGDGREAGGLTAGLYTIGAISSLGKTTFAMQMADSIAARGKDVLVIALEMSVFELMAKSISRITTETAETEKDRKTVQGILQGARYAKYSESERQTIDQAKAIYKEMAKHLYFMEGIGDIGVAKVRLAIKQHIEMRGEAPVVIVDYLQILAPADPHATDKTNTDKAVLELKRISRDYNTPVICISSFNRDNYSERVSMKALKESGAIEYSSDVVIGLQLKGAGAKDFDVDAAKQKEPREIEAVILKNRSGKTGQTVEFEYTPRFNLFEEANGGHKYGIADLPDVSAIGTRNR